MMSDFDEREKAFNKRFEETQKEIDEALAQARRMRTTCEWTHHEYQDYWSTDCENAFSFVDDTPSENGFLYCPYCGRKLLEVQPEEEENE